MKRQMEVVLRDLRGEPITADPHIAQRAFAALYAWMQAGASGADEALQPLRDSMRHSTVHLTLGRLCVDVLAGRFADEQQISGEELLRRYRLGARIVEAGANAVDLDSADVELIKRLVVKAGYTAAVYGAVCQCLDSDPPAVPPPSLPPAGS